MNFTLNDFIGNCHVTRELTIELEACRRRNVRPDHILITGYSGTGKTRLANTIANETGMAFLDVNAPLVKNLFHDVIYSVSIYADSPTDRLIYAPTIVFFDEAHELNTETQNALLKIMLEGVTVRDGIEHDLRNVTFVFATTDADKLLAPLKQRCELKFELKRYTVAELTHILQKITVEDSGALYELAFASQVAYEVAKRARYTPRIGLSYMKRIYNHARALADSPEEAAALVTVELAEDFFKLRRINDQGLTPRDIDYLRTLHLARKPMGVSSIAAQLEINNEECTKDIEPFLRYCRLINFTKTGREITPLGIEILRRYEEREKLEEQLADGAVI